MDPRTLVQLNEAYRNEVYLQEEILSEEEYLDIQEWVEALIDEGYDLDQYTDEELYEAYLAEANRGDEHATASMFMSREPDTKKAKKYRRQGRDFRGFLHPSDWETQGEPARQKAHKKGRGVRTRGTGVRQVGTYREELDLYDLVSEYLISEGFCDSYEDADVIMANMSEEWREGIVEEVLDEANKLEKHLNLSPDETVRRRQDQNDLGGRRPRRTYRGSGQVKGGDPSLGVSVWKGGRKPDGDLDRGRDIDHKRSRGRKKQRGKVTRSMRGPNYNVGNYLDTRYGED